MPENTAMPISALLQAASAVDNSDGAAPPGWLAGDVPCGRGAALVWALGIMPALKC